MAGLATLTDPARVRALNDTFRRRSTGGRVVVSAGVVLLPGDTRTAVLTAVRAFDCSNVDDDPYGEHDFGTIVVGGVRVFWKIDCYDRALACASPDPADPGVTTRVLTIMLAEEY